MCAKSPRQLNEGGLEPAEVGMQTAGRAQAKVRASCFRALVLIGVAAAFCAALMLHITKCSVTSTPSLAEVNPWSISVDRLHDQAEGLVHYLPRHLAAG